MIMITRLAWPGGILRVALAVVLRAKSVGMRTPTAPAEFDEKVVLHRNTVPLPRVFKLSALGGIVLLIFLVGQSLPVQAASLALKTPSDFNLPGIPTVSTQFINRVLLTYHSPAAGTGQALYHDGVMYGIDPVFALAFFLHESTFGTVGVARVTHSLGNIRCTAGYSCYHGYRAYASWQQGYLDWYKLIRNVYIDQRGLMTVDQIIPVYAPANENNVRAYIAAVKHAVATWRTGQVIVR